MGFDLYGNQKFKGEEAYFRAAIGNWPAIWGFCQKVAPTLTGMVKDPYVNGADGLTDWESKALGIELLLAIARGQLDEEGEYLQAKVPMFANFLLICGGFRIC